uniref:Uncharacterized protein n=1 Tax=Anguilla anguilla TaxID=7936 RepID=A0A0E9W379_ANGAN
MSLLFLWQSAESFLTVIFDLQVSTYISAFPSDILNWMENHHLKLILAETEMLYIPAITTPVVTTISPLSLAQELCSGSRYQQT